MSNEAPERVYYIRKTSDKNASFPYQIRFNLPDQTFCVAEQHRTMHDALSSKLMVDQAERRRQFERQRLEVLADSEPRWVDLRFTMRTNQTDEELHGLALSIYSFINQSGMDHIDVSRRKIATFALTTISVSIII